MLMSYQILTECYTKWIETVALKQASGAVVANFIENIIFCIGIPKCLLSHNGNPFLNTHMRELLNTCGIYHVKSSVYYPQRNGQVEAINKTLLRILSRMVYEEPKKLLIFFFLVLWAYHTSKLNFNLSHVFLFSLLAEAMIMVP